MSRHEGVWIGLVFFLITGWGFVPETVAGLRVQIVGSTTVLPLASRSAQMFMESSKIRILVNAGGSGVGIYSVAQGRADI